jgi:hypothetical protein
MRSGAPLVALAALGACSGSVVIRADDATFSLALRRYERTKAVVASLSPDADDESMFLLAESFYRYRFQLPPRKASYVVQVAAVALDLPVL